MNYNFGKYSNDVSRQNNLENVKDLSTEEKVIAKVWIIKSATLFLPIHNIFRKKDIPIGTKRKIL